jgi:transposase
MTRVNLAELKEVVRVGVDLAKNVIQVHAVTADGRVISNRPLAREKFVSWCGQLSRGTLVAMEACSGAHHWARELTAMGLEARLVSAVFVAPYRMQGRLGKNDANDAMAVCEAASRPMMRFVPIKTIEQQGLMVLHRLREGIKKDRTACINRIRGLLAEFGLVFPKSPHALREGLSRVVSGDAEVLDSQAILGLRSAALHLSQLDAHLKSCDRSIGFHCRTDPKARAAAALQGVGPIGASALIASVGDVSVFKNGAQFGAWLGLTPRQHSSGGTVSLGRITKRGDQYLRTLLIQGARMAVITAHKRGDAISRWALQLRKRVGWQKATVAMANKNARILWAILSKGDVFDPDHEVSHKRLQRSLF